VDTTGLTIMISGSSVQVIGELKKLKASSFDSGKTQKKLMEDISMRLRQHKQIKRVMFL